MSKSLVRTLDALADEYEGKKIRKSVITDPRNPIIGTRLNRTPIKQSAGASTAFAV